MLPNLYFQKEIKSLKFLKGTRNAVYVGPELSPEDKALLTETGVTVIFVQDVLADLTKEVLDYNFPGVVLPEGFSADSIYAWIRSELEFDADPSHYMVVHFEYGNFAVYDALTSIDKLLWYLKKLADRPEKKLRRAIKWSNPFNKMSSFSGSLYETVNNDIAQDEDCDMIVTDRDLHFRVTPQEVPLPERPEKTADQLFNEEMDKEAAEVKRLVNGLILKGFPAEIIKTWLKEAVKLSRLRITRQFRILLVDYDKEVIMRPLAKTVFLFYLRHPEGVQFSYLQDHAKELRMIYGHVSVNDNPQRMDASIASLINPFSNSICEKCAAVKGAFMSLIDDDIACNYYITGMQGGKKGISLDRSLVEWECEL